MRRLLAGIVGMSLFIAACGSTGTADTGTTALADTATTSIAATTVAPVTTSAPTTAAPATTMAPTTTAAPTTTTAAPTTTTTLPPIVGDPPVALQLGDAGIQAGEVWIDFGTNDVATVAALRAVLGPPTFDSGWVDSFSGYGTCPPPVVRGVEWGSFVALFTRAETGFQPAGVPHFFSYYYTDGDDPAGVTTTEGIAIGDTLAELEAAYPGGITVDESWIDPGEGFWTYGTMDWDGLWGYADGTTPDAHILSINGSRGCGE